MTPAPARLDRLEPLTSLRFFAAAMIVAFHGAGLGVGPQWLLDFSLSQGVSFFFVLSGFVLAYSYPTLADRGAVRRFYVARFARIWPLHVVTMVLMALFVESSIPRDRAVEVTLAHLTLTQAWVPLTSFVMAYNAVSWSLSVELFFYLMFPALIAGWERTRWLKLGIAFGAAFAMWALATVFAGADSEAAGLRSGLDYFHPLVRLFEFTLGIAACELYRRHGEQVRRRLSTRSATWLELGVVLLAIASLWSSKQLSAWLSVGSPAAKTLSTVLGTSGYGAFVWALLIWVFAVGRGFPARALSIRPMIFLGEASYALYLVHMILLKYRGERRGLFPDLSQQELLLLYWGAAIGVASALYLAIERPWREIIRRLGEGRRDAPLARGLALLGVTGAVVAFVVAFPPSSRSTYAASDASAPASRLLAEPATFEPGFRLDGIELLPRPDGNALLQFSWTALKDGPVDLVVAVHLLDDKGKAEISNLDHAMDTAARRARAGERWSTRIPASRTELRRIDRLGIGLYSKAGLLQVRGGPANTTDLGDRRLLVYLPGKAPPPVTFVAQPLVAEPVTFEAGFRLDGLELSFGSDGSQSLVFSWSALVERPLDLQVAVHLLDAKGAIVRQLDHAMDKDARLAKPGERWIARIPAPNVDSRRFDRMGIALYSNAGIAPVRAGPAITTDMNGQRLLVYLAAKSPTPVTFTSKPLLASPVSFEVGYRLEGLELSFGSDGSRFLTFSWTALVERPRDLQVAVHLLDTKGKMIHQLDHAMDKDARLAKAGEKWSTRISADAVEPKRVETLGIALYDKSGIRRVSPEYHDATDWGGLRLLVDASR